MNENDRYILGITASNAWGNLFSYSLLAAHSLDMSASAAGRIDTEAARLLRIAQNMIRTRIDIIVKQSFYYSRETEKGTIRLNVNPNQVLEFSSLQVACSEDSARLQNADNREKTAADLKHALLTIDGEKAQIDGVLISNLVEIIKAELAFYRMPLENSMNPISEEQRDLMNSLKFGAIVVSDIIHQAVERLKDKLEARQDLYVCMNCGDLYYMLPEKCGTCEAGQSLIVRYPFPIRGNVETWEKYLYERYNPALNVK